MLTASSRILLIIIYLGSVYSHTDEEVARYEAFYDYLESNGTHRDTNMELRGNELPITRQFEFPGVASLQRAPGYQPIGLPAVYVTQKHVLSIKLVAEILRFDFLHKKELVVVSNSLTPGVSGIIKKVTQIIGATQGFALLKILGKNSNFVQPAKKYYRFSKFDKLTIVKWKGITNTLVKITDVEYKPGPCTLLGFPAPDYIGCLTQENLFISDVCAPVFNKRKQLVGMVAVPSLGLAGSEYFYKIPDIITTMIALAQGTPPPS